MPPPIFLWESSATSRKQRSPKAFALRFLQLQDVALWPIPVSEEALPCCSLLLPSPPPTIPGSHCSRTRGGPWIRPTSSSSICPFHDLPPAQRTPGLLPSIHFLHPEVSQDTVLGSLCSHILSLDNLICSQAFAINCVLCV